MCCKTIHLGIDNPIKVLLAFIRAIRPTMNWAEEPGSPFDTLVGALGGFVSLAVLDLGLFVRGGFMVSGFDGLYRPEP